MSEKAQPGHLSFCGQGYTVAPSLLLGASAWSWHQWTGSDRACGPWELGVESLRVLLCLQDGVEQGPVPARVLGRTQGQAGWPGPADRPTVPTLAGQDVSLSRRRLQLPRAGAAEPCPLAGRCALAPAFAQRSGLLGGRSRVTRPFQVAAPWHLEQGCRPPSGRCVRVRCQARGARFPVPAASRQPAPPATLRPGEPPGQTLPQL